MHLWFNIWDISCWKEVEENFNLKLYLGYITESKLILNPDDFRSAWKNLRIC